MEGTDEKLNSLLMRNVKFQTPFIQRIYSWNETDVVTFLEDIIREGRCHDNGMESNEYFIGAFILKEIRSTSLDGTTIYLLYDGEQRLVTISLIYGALFFFYKTHPELLPEDFEKPEDILQYIYNNQNKNKTKLQLKEEDQRQYKQILEGNVDDKGPHMHLMFNLIQRKINTANHLHILRGLMKLRVVIIQLDNNDNADMIFNTMNTMGRKLSFEDKLRNICLLNLDDKEQSDAYHNQWKPFYDKYQKYGFDKHKAQWTMGLAIFHNIGRKGRETTTNIIKDLRPHGPIKTLHMLTEYDDVLIRMIENKKYHKITSHLMSYGLISGILGMYLIDNVKDEKRITKQECESLIRLLGSYCVRHMILGQKNFPPLMVAAMHSLINSNSDNLFSEIMTLLTNHNGRTFEGIPEDIKIIKKINQTEYREQEAKRLLVMLETEMNPRCGDLKDMTVEHILPKKNKASISTGINSLGNLTLMPSNINTRLSNKSFKDKKKLKGGFNESTLMLDEYVKQQENFGIQQIDERRKLLGRKICQLWPDKISEN